MPGFFVCRSPLLSFTPPLFRTACYSMRIPVSLRIRVHFASSSWMRRVKSSGVLLITSEPSFSKVWRVRGWSSTFSSASRTFATTSFGVADGSGEGRGRRRFEAADARFVDRRHVGQEHRALQCRHRDRAQLARLDVRARRADLVEHEMDLPAEEIDHRGAAALVRHVQELHLRHRLEKLAGQVRVRARAGGAHQERPGLRFRERDQLLHACAPAPTDGRRARSA